MTAQAGEPRESASVAAGWLPLVGFYAIYFASNGILLPFLPAYLKGLSLTGGQVGALLALSPLMSLLSPPIFGHWADRTGRADRILTLISAGAFVGFLPLLVTRSFVAVAAALVTYAFFASSMTSLLDTLALNRVSLVGGSYSRLRLFGSLGFVCSSALFGALVDHVDGRTVIAAVALIGCYLAWSFAVRARTPPTQHVGMFGAWGLLKHRDVALLLCACALHWIACAAYHGNFSIHVAELKLPPWVVGTSAGLGVVAEIAVMYLYPSLAERISPRQLLIAAFLASALRWWAMATTSSAAAIIGLSLLHGFTFGAFYVGAIAFLARRVPVAQRASGQALFASVTFGLGGLVGYLSAGAGYDWLSGGIRGAAMFSALGVLNGGGHRLFAVGAVLEVVAALVLLAARPARKA